MLFMCMKKHYTKEVLEIAVKNNTSVFGIIREIGLKINGGSHAQVKRWIKTYGIDTSHFLGKHSNRGESHVGGPKKLTAKQILVVNRRNGMREKIEYLRMALSERGVKRECKDCGLGEVWNKKPIALQVEYINGNPLDNREKNLCYLCPNCHTQTPTFGGKKRDCGEIADT